VLLFDEHLYFFARYSEGLLNKEVQFLSKPYTRRELARKIRFVLSEGSFPQKEEGSNAKQTHSDSGR
jgi:hypothetical protein